MGLKSMERTPLTVQLRGMHLLLGISTSLIAKNTRAPADHKISKRSGIKSFGDHNTEFI